MCSRFYNQDKPQGTIQINPEDINWVDAPAPLPAGSKVAVLEGNPKEEGIFTMRVFFPPCCKFSVHSHTKDERVTVISGIMYVGFGDVFDSTKADKFISGSFYINPAHTKHFVFTEGEDCIFQVTGQGPWGVNYMENSDKKNK